MTGKLKFMRNITREIVRNNPDELFVFGDNMLHQGYGGQAKQMRGEPNTVGIPTKWFPSMNNNAFFHNDDWENHQVQREIINGFIMIEKHLLDGNNVVVPSGGIGTGRAKLDTNAPVIFKFITDIFEVYKKRYGD